MTDTRVTKLKESARAKVCVVKEAREPFEVEEVLEIRKWICTRQIENKCRAVLVNTGLVHDSKIFVLTCETAEEAGRIVELLKEEGKTQNLVICRLPDLPIPSRIRAMVSGLVMSKESVIPHMELTNWKRGFSFVEWKMVGFEQDPTGERVQITFEVPKKDAEEINP